MAGKISQATIDHVKALNIVDVVGDYVELKKSGGNFKVCCPFHGEKTPSLVISPSKNIWHCFGACSTGGDAIKFVQEHNKLSFAETIEEIAGNNGIAVTYEEGGDTRERDSIYKINEMFLGFSVSKLRDKDIEYLHNRGFNDETIEEWGLGYGSNSDDAIAHYVKNFIPIPEAINAGVLGNGKNGVYNFFSRRITFPIKNQSGKVVGFAGRALKSDAKQKYLNSREGKLFSKGKILFGLDQARAAAIKKGWLIVQEGQFDTMLTHQIGIKNTAGTQGTALTVDHVRMIKKMHVKVLLAYDGDKAGINAAFKASKLLSENDIDGGVAIFNQGDDSADMVATGRVDELKEVFKQGAKKRLIAFVLEQIENKYNLVDAFELRDAVNEANSFLSSLDPIVASAYQGLFYKIFNVQPKGRVIEPITPLSHSLVLPTATLEDTVLFTLHEEPWNIDTVESILNREAFTRKELFDDVVSLEPKIFASSGIALLHQIDVLSEDALILALISLNKHYKKSALNSMTSIEDALKVLG